MGNQAETADMAMVMPAGMLVRAVTSTDKIVMVDRT